MNVAITKLSLAIAGVIDMVLGVALLLVPDTVLSIARLETSTETPWLRLLGVEMTVAGSAAFAVSRREEPDGSIFTSTAIARVAAGIVLVTGGRRAGGGSLVLPALGAVELALGAFHISYVLRKGR